MRSQRVLTREVAACKGTSHGNRMVESVTSIYAARKSLPAGTPIYPAYEYMLRLYDPKLPASALRSLTWLICNGGMEDWVVSTSGNMFGSMAPTTATEIANGFRIAMVLEMVERKHVGGNRFAYHILP